MTTVETPSLSGVLRAIRAQRRRRLLLEGAAGVAMVVLVAVGLGLLLSALLGGGSTGTIVMRVVGWSLIVAGLVRLVIIPVSRRIDDDHLALYVEEHAPELRQHLVSAVHVAHDVGDQPASTLGRLVIEQAVTLVDPLASGNGIERPRIRRALGLLTGALGAAVLLVRFGPSAIRDVAHTLFVPWSAAASVPVRAIAVTPGDVRVARGAALDLKAESRGFIAATAELIVVPDSAPDVIRTMMLPDSLGRRFGVRLFDVTQSGSYYVEAEGVRSASYRITVTDLPAVTRVGVALQFPAYTGLAIETVEDGGDVTAVRGTRATLTIAVTRPVRAGSLHFDDDRSVPLSILSCRAFGILPRRPRGSRWNARVRDGSVRG
jgi:hypothetical protein